MVFEAAFIFVFGLCVGSFLNAVIYRLNNERSPFSGRSFCPKCKHTLAWDDLIPLLSFVFLGGKCRYCKEKISWQYPLVELTTGLLALVLWKWEVGSLSYLSYLRFILLFGIFSSFLVIFVSDLLYQTVPTTPLFLGVAVTLIYLLITSHLSLITLLVAFLSFLFFLALFLITKGKGMGFGDALLALFIGLFLGWPKTLISFYLAFLTGAFIGVILILIGKKRFGEHIAFGPFLVASALVAFFWGDFLWRVFLAIIGMG